MKFILQWNLASYYLSGCGYYAKEGPFCEMLWSDPCSELGRHPSKRGVGVAFGPDITKVWLCPIHAFPGLLGDISHVVTSHVLVSCITPSRALKYGALFDLCCRSSSLQIDSISWFGAMK